MELKKYGNTLKKAGLVSAIVLLVGLTVGSSAQARRGSDDFLEGGHRSGDHFLDSGFDRRHSGDDGFRSRGADDSGRHGAHHRFSFSGRLFHR